MRLHSCGKKIFYEKKRFIINSPFVELYIFLLSLLLNKKNINKSIKIENRYIIKLNIAIESWV